MIGEHLTQFAGLPVEDYDFDVVVDRSRSVMPRREFRVREGKSDKFWAITLDGDRYTVQFGRVGTTGQTQTKKYSSPGEARYAYQLLIEAKVKKGYAEVRERPQPGVPRRREFQVVKGTSRKFWAVALEGKSLTVQFGRLGTAGQTQTRDFDSPAEAHAACEKLVAEKVGKGYIEVGGQAAVPAGPEATGAVETARADQPLPVAYRLTLFGAGEQSLETFLNDPAAGQVEALIIGFWDYGPSGEVVEALVAGREKLPRLKALFLGDITYEEWDIAYIQQSDLSPLFGAFPGLEELRVRGADGLALGRVRHDNLRVLAFESGGLPRGVVRDVLKARLPALEHLELWLGTEEYGGDTRVADLKPLLEGKLFPKLRYLGLRDSEIADDMAAAVARAPVLKKVRVLDLSLGNLGDEGAEALLASPAVARLEKLDIHHHFVSDALVARLKALGIEVDAGERQKVYDDDEGRYIAVSE
jgi:predicted DNA-binding WGR domain protein